MDDRSRYDVVVIGATPAGIAAGVRTAREGLETVITSHQDHIGGMLTGGMCGVESFIDKRRTPVLDEFVEAVRAHYRTEYGEDSAQYRECREGYAYEPHVAEAIFEGMVGAEPALSVRTGRRVTEVGRTADAVGSVRITPTRGTDSATELAADTFIDATYEGDLAAAAGVPYRLGRESRAEFDEQFAGRIYTTTNRLGRASSDEVKLYNRDVVGRADSRLTLPDGAKVEWFDLPEAYRQGGLEMHPMTTGTEELFSGSTGAGDDAIQAYNYRFVLTTDPDNRRYPEKPEGYDREEYVDLATAGMRVLQMDVEDMELTDLFLIHPKPNDKADINTGDLPGENHAYPEGDRETREAIADRHRDYLLGLLYYLQNDEAVPDELQAEALEWGLPLDEFQDTDNFPFQLYVREARRIEGRSTFTENDVRVAEGLDRAPINPGAVAIADFMIDVHGCRRDRVTGSEWEGKVLQPEVTRPGQVEYGSMLPRELDNLLVPVAVSATHVGFSAVRFEPAWMNLGEAAGYAAGLAAETGVPPGEVEVTDLQRRLVESGVLISFFNELDRGDEALDAALGFLGTKGFFDGYAARPADPLTARTAEVWSRTVGDLVVGEPYDATDRARQLPEAPHDAESDDALTVGSFADRIVRELRYRGADTAPLDEALAAEGADRSSRITRGTGAALCYRLLGD